MPVYTERSDDKYYINVVDFRNMEQASWRSKFKVEFKVQNENLSQFHRTDGPAIVTWDWAHKGYTHLYYILGKQVNKDKYLRVLRCPTEQLPLYINEPLYGEIAKARLRGDNTTIEYSKNKHLQNDIRIRAMLPDERQLMAINLIRTITKAVQENIQHLKPFKVLN